MTRPGFICLLGFILTACPFFGQLATRSGSAGLTADAPLNVGCGGNTLLYTDFESGIPAGWMVIDGDTLDPMPTTGLVRGWQIREDYRDTTNLVLVNCSFTTPSGMSNDWLITPMVSLGSSGCLSWKVYSQDNYYLESYEIWVGNGADTTSLKGGTRVYSTTNASSSVKHLSVDLSAFAGQTISIGFHHVSTDKFVLALDDIRLTSRFEPDAWAYQMDTSQVLAFQTVYPQMVVANAGTDTMESFSVHYQVNGGSTYTITRSGFSLGTGDSVRVVHDSAWIPSTTGTYTLCMWVDAPNGLADANPLNDTLCHTFQVTSFIGIEEDITRSWELYPTVLTAGFVCIRGIQTGTWEVYDATGKLGITGAIHEKINLPALSPGIYLLRISDPAGRIKNFRIMVP